MVRFWFCDTQKDHRRRIVSPNSIRCQVCMDYRPTLHCFCDGLRKLDGHSVFGISTSLLWPMYAGIEYYFLDPLDSPPRVSISANDLSRQPTGQASSRSACGSASQTVSPSSSNNSRREKAPRASPRSADYLPPRCKISHPMIAKSCVERSTRWRLVHRMDMRRRGCGERSQFDSIE